MIQLQNADHGSHMSLKQIEPMYLPNTNGGPASSSTRSLPAGTYLSRRLKRCVLILLMHVAYFLITPGGYHFANTVSLTAMKMQEGGEAD